MASPPASQAGVATAQLHHHLTVGVIKPLTTFSHHVGDGVNLDGLKFVRNLPADIPKLDRHLIVDLTLNGQVKLIVDAGSKIRIQTLAGTCSNLFPPPQIRLRPTRPTA